MRTFIALVVALSFMAACSPGPATGSTTTTVLTGTDAPTTTVATSTTTTTTVPTTATPAAADVIVEGGTAAVPELTVTGPAIFSFDVGDQVEISVLSSVSDEIHVHGYDIHFDAVAGEVTVVELTADVPGIFEVELEEHQKPLFEIEVGG